jgi:hypothetical protein
MRSPRTLALLPALAALLVPKCPLCVAAYLSAAGFGAALARAVAPVVVRGARVAAIAVAIALALRAVTILRAARIA